MRARSRTLLAARTLALISFALASATLFLTSDTRTAAGLAASQQKRQTTRRTDGVGATRAPAPPRRTPATDYARFSHASAAHSKRDCATCHRIVSFERPDIEDFPDHPSCVECHRQQFFRGARPVICSVCHVATSPRASGRLFFPKPSRAGEFADVFPHANHVKTTSLIQFKKVIGEKSNIQATCLYCHRPSPAPPASSRTTTGPPAAAAGPPAPAFVPAAGTFMTTPTSHANCFQCHWQKGVADHEQEPYATQCASCHRNTAATVGRAAIALTVESAPASRTAPARAAPLVDSGARSDVDLLEVPASFGALFRPAPPRAAPKFVHEIDAHKKRLNEEGREVAITCLQCHAAARKATTLEALRLRENRAGLPTCSSSACHTAVAGAAQLHLSVYRELRERAKDSRFDCALCHTPPASLSTEVPCTHYAAVYASALKEKKSTKGVEQLTPTRCAGELKGNAP